MSPSDGGKKMPSDPIRERISAWQEAGLLDSETADRLRAYEASSRGSEAADGPRRDPLPFFGPVPTVSEAFAYLGGGFVLAAAYVLVSSQLLGVDSWQKWAIATAGIAVLAAVAGLAIRSRGPRLGRAAGVFFAVAVANVGAAVFNVTFLLANETERFLYGAVAAFGVAAVLRRLHPSLLTQASVIGSVIVAAAALTRWTERGGLEGLAIDLAIWFAASVVIGALVLIEQPSADLDGSRRAALSRFAAGMTAVIAAAAILTRRDEGFGYERLLEPWVAELGIVAVSVAILALALRRGSTAYLYPAALGIVIALTDANGAYIADQAGTGVALLIEGVVLLVAGLGADRLRRRLGRSSRAAGPEPVDGGSSA